MKRRPRQAVDPGGNETADHTLCLCGCRHDRLLANQHNPRSRHCVLTNLFVRADAGESSGPVVECVRVWLLVAVIGGATVRLGPFLGQDLSCMRGRLEAWTPPNPSPHFA